MTRSPIELFWTAKKEYIYTLYFKREWSRTAILPNNKFTLENSTMAVTKFEGVVILRNGATVSAATPHHPP